MGRCRCRGNERGGGSKAAPPQEHQGGLIGEDLCVWEEKGEAGLGRGQDKRKKEKSSSVRSHTVAVLCRGSPATADTGGVVGDGPPFPSQSLPPASLATVETCLGRKESDPQG